MCLSLLLVVLEVNSVSQTDIAIAIGIRILFVLYFFVSSQKSHPPKADQIVKVKRYRFTRLSILHSHPFPCSNVLCLTNWNSNLEATKTVFQKLYKTSRKELTNHRVHFKFSLSVNGCCIHFKHLTYIIY